jgi:ORF6C domain
VLYQREVVKALWAVFWSDILLRDMLAEGDQHLSPFEQQYHEMMDNAAAMRRQLADLDEQVGEMGVEVGEIRDRLGALEARLLRGMPVNSQEALHIKDMVAAVADNLATATGRTRSKCFSDTYQEFYHAFDIHIYTELPQTEYQNAVQWFIARWRRITPDRPLPSVFSRGRQTGF